MKGAEVISRALSLVSDRIYGVPGYPVTSLLDATAAETVINEKVAVEYALGDSLSGRRAAVLLKNVGMNACADPFVEATTQGLVGGVVIVAGDDPEAEGSQNAQDSRYYGELAEVPVIEPGSWNIAESVSAAFRASEEFSRIVILRVTPPLLDREAREGSPVRDAGRGACVPLDHTMRGRVQRARNMLPRMQEWSDSSPLNHFEGDTAFVGAAGHPDANGELPGASRVSTVYPIPVALGNIPRIRELGRFFAGDHRPVFPHPGKDPERHSHRGFFRSFCRDCPFIPAMKVLEERKMPVICDAGCCVLCMNPPYTTGQVSYGMGSSIAVAAKSTGIALTGDYALLHSGLPALIDVREKGTPLLCIVMKNDCMGMTGGQVAYDIMPYIGWASPVTCPAGDTGRLRELLVAGDTLKVILIEGVCPEGRHHETVEC